MNNIAVPWYMRPRILILCGKLRKYSNIFNGAAPLLFVIIRAAMQGIMNFLIKADSFGSRKYCRAA